MQKPIIPSIDLSKIKILMICESFPDNMDDYFYSNVDSLYVTNTIAAFNSAGMKVNSIMDIMDRGVFLTVAVKTQRIGLTVPAETIQQYAPVLQAEIESFPDLKAILLMGDAAIKAFNIISQKTAGRRAIPAGPTYKIRKDRFYHKGIRIFPSYLQTGKNFLIEKAKRQMVAEDIKEAFKLIRT